MFPSTLLSALTSDAAAPADPSSSTIDAPQPLLTLWQSAAAQAELLPRPEGLEAAAPAPAMAKTVGRAALPAPAAPLPAMNIGQQIGAEPSAPVGAPVPSTGSVPAPTPTPALPAHGVLTPAQTQQPNIGTAALPAEPAAIIAMPAANRSTEKHQAATAAALPMPSAEPAKIEQPAIPSPSGAAPAPESGTRKVSDPAIVSRPVPSGQPDPTAARSPSLSSADESRGMPLSIRQMFRTHSSQMQSRATVDTLPAAMMNGPMPATAEPAPGMTVVALQEVASGHAAATEQARASALPLRAEPGAASAHEQVREAMIHRGSSSRIEVRLDPPELGRVQIEFDMRGHGPVRAVVSAAEAETLEMLKRQGGSLLADLRDSGFGDVELNWSEHSGRQNQPGERAALLPLPILPDRIAATPRLAEHDGTLNLTL